MIIKLVHDELVKILGSDNETLNINNIGLTKILLIKFQFDLLVKLKKMLNRD